MVSVLYGDPGKAAPYAIRVKFPANYEVPAHSHPTDENITVASGTLFLGMGDKLDTTRGTKRNERRPAPTRVTSRTSAFSVPGTN